MINLSNRLKAVADMVPAGSKICDVGTDHGYIPVYLVQNKICPNAIACDINEQPLKSCEFLVRESGLTDKIKCILSNGLDSVPNDEYDTVILAGMGGELISNILSRIENKEQKQFVINPMTHSEIVRKWLYDNGYQIKNDIVVADGKHHYCVFLAKYSGAVVSKTESDYYLGEIKDFSDKEYFMHLLTYLKNKEKSGRDFSKVIHDIEAKL